MSSRFQILSLDGGGIKGMFSAAVLAHLEADLGIHISKHFDLIAGTSTGGIIALGLGLGLRPREILDFYVDEAPRIFPQRPVRLALKAYVRSKYSSDPLKEALRRRMGDRLLGESKKRLIVPAFNLEKTDVYIFRTSHHERLRRDYRVPMWKVALATSAAPTYFPSFNEVDNIRLVDGGLWANNPTMVALVEAVSTLGVPMDSIQILSIGTSFEVKRNPQSLDRAGKMGWRSAGIEIALRAQGIGALNQARLLLGKENVLRLDTAVPDGYFGLDRISTEAFLSHAAHESRSSAPEFMTRFCGHSAEPFTPSNAL